MVLKINSFKKNWNLISCRWALWNEGKKMYKLNGSEDAEIRLQFIWEQNLILVTTSMMLIMESSSAS